MLQKMRKCVVVLLIISLFASSVGLVCADTPTTNGGQNNGFIPKEEPAMTGLEEILSKYKKN